MKDLKLFILPSCPYCLQALSYIRELQAEDVRYQKVKFQVIDEVRQSSIADLYDYYYVPSFYLNEQKAHEGIVSKEQVKKIFDDTLNS